MVHADLTDYTRFDSMYRDTRVSEGLPAATPWDIGGPQPVVRQLVAVGAITGEVLDPGTGPGHHAIHFAQNGYSVTGIDGSAEAIRRARENARRAGVSVDFQVADATKLEGYEGRFDTVVDCAFYHTFGSDRALQSSYVHALWRATKPCARLYLFEFGEHEINGFRMIKSLAERDFREVLPEAGWNITYVGPAAFRVHLSVAAIDIIATNNPDMAERVDALRARYREMAPWLEGGDVYAPFWEVHATRAD